MQATNFSLTQPENTQQDLVGMLTEHRCGLDGAPDSLRPTVYMGEAQILTNMGPLPISFEIDASSLADAIARYGEAAKEGVENAMRELQEMRRQASSSLVIPQGGVPNLGGGGKIQLP
jgi:hypothetical protein